MKLYGVGENPSKAYLSKDLKQRLALLQQDGDRVDTLEKGFSFITSEGTKITRVT